VFLESSRCKKQKIKPQITQRAQRKNDDRAVARYFIAVDHDHAN